MRWLRRNLLVSALGLLTTAGPAEADETLQPLLADTTVNHVEQGEAFLLWNGRDEFYAAEPELIKWRVRRPFPEPVSHGGTPYYRIRDIVGATAELDMRAMAISIHLPPQVLQRQHRQIRGAEPPAPSAALGFYVDYDLSYVSEEIDRYPLAFLAPTFFSGAGVLHSEFLYRGLDASPGDGNGVEQLVRLDTTWGRATTPRACVHTAPVMY